MAAYNWDLGFNLTDLPDPDNANLPPLLQGCVGFNAQNIGYQTPYPPVLNLGDTLCFNALNQTPNAQQGDCKIIYYKILFHAGDSTSPESPFDTAVFELNCSQVSNCMSQSVSLSPSTSLPAYCPVVYLGPTLKKGTSFNFTFWLTVLGPDNKSKEFRVDPQMIVGSAS